MKTRVKLKAINALFGLLSDDVTTSVEALKEANHLILIAKLSISKVKYSSSSKNVIFIFEHEMMLRKKYFIILNQKVQNNQINWFLKKCSSYYLYKLCNYVFKILYLPTNRMYWLPRGTVWQSDRRAHSIPLPPVKSGAQSRWTQARPLLSEETTRYRTSHHDHSLEPEKTRTEIPDLAVNTHRQGMSLVQYKKDSYTMLFFN